MDEADHILPQYLQIANALKYVEYIVIFINLRLNAHELGLYRIVF